MLSIFSCARAGYARVKKPEKAMIGIFHYALVLLAIPISIVLFVLFMRCKVSIQLITAVL